MKPRINTKRISATSVSGVKVLYDAGYLYDQSNLYYDRWYISSGDTVDQAEIPVAKSGQEMIGLRAKIEDIPRIKVEED